MQPTLTLHGLGAFRGTRKRVPDHRYGNYRGSSHGQDNIQIKKDKIQRPGVRQDYSRHRMGILRRQQLDAVKNVTARGTPRRVVYRNQHAHKGAPEEHALEYTTRGSPRFQAEFSGFRPSSRIAAINMVGISWRDGEDVRSERSGLSRCTFQSRKPSRRSNTKPRRA